MPKRYKLFSWNVNGIRAAERKGLLDWVAKAKPDVLCLQETKAMPEQLSEALKNVKGYGVEFNSAERKGYSGVATYAKPEPKAVERGLGKKEFDNEGRVLLHHFPDFSIFNVYFPNGQSRKERLDYKMRFYDWFLKTIAKLRKKGRDKIIVCGDVNTAHTEIDLARPKENRETSGFLPMERAWIDKLIGAGFIDTFREFETGGGHYTYWDQITRARDRNVGWRIDYFFVSENLKPNLKKARIHSDVMGSDHCPISAELVF